MFISQPEMSGRLGRYAFTNKRRRKIGAALMVAMASFGAYGHVTQSNSANSAPSDITDVMLENLSGDCKQYLGSFFSKVTDIQRSMLFQGKVSISSKGKECIVESNAIPNHDFNDRSARFATDVSEQTLRLAFTANPQFSKAPTPLSLSVSEGVLLNGVTVDLLAAACYGVGDGRLGREKIGCGQRDIDNPWRYDPMSELNSFGTDEHNAHVQPTGNYHYHGNPMALFKQNCAGGQASPVIGFAADGFPIYGSCFVDPIDGVVKKARSSYQLKSGKRQSVDSYSTPQGGRGSVASDSYDGQFRGDWEYVAKLGELDECNGMTVDGQYGYYVTDTFPWVLNCFKGSVNRSFSQRESARSHTHPQKMNHNSKGPKDGKGPMHHNKKPRHH